MRKSAGEFLRLLRTAAVALAVEIGLRVLPVHRLAALLGVDLSTSTREALAPRATASLPAWLRQHADRTDRVLHRLPVEASCLRRSLVLGHALRRSSPQLRLGVRRDPSGEVLAHAWLEVGSYCLTSDGREYVALGIA